ncbi:MAG: MEDS domain-containing protein, partial [Candidatus Saliniplasma sp.]
MDEKLKRKLEEQVLGSHMCCIYRNKNEQLSLASNYILMGLKRGERCVYIVDDRTKEEVIEALRGLEVEIERYIDSRQLVFLTKKNSYLKDGYFDPDEMIELLRKNEESALKEGFKGLRVTGEMTWVFTGLPGTERLMEYEAKLNQFFPGSRSMGLCQYNENKFSQEILVDVIHTHPVVVIYDSIYDNHRYVPPELFLARIKGEVQEEQYESIKNDVIEREVLVEKEKERREELRRSKELVSNIIESTSIPMFVIDSDHKLIHWNRACERLTGISSDEIVGTKDLWKAFYHEERPVLADLIVEEASEDEVAEFYEGKYSKMRLIDGAYEAEDFFPQFGEEGRWVYFTAAPLLDSDGDIIGAVETLQDITERKETEEELRELNRFRERIIQDV